MKARLGLIAVFAALGAVAYALFAEKPARERPPQVSAETPSAPPSPAGIAPPREIHSIRRLLVRKPPSGKSAIARTSPACRAFEAGILGISLDDLDYPPKVARLPSPRGCRPKSARVAKLFDLYNKACAETFVALPTKKLSRDEWQAKFRDCELAFITARATLAILSRETKPIAEMNDLGDLADVLVAEIAELQTSFTPAVVANLLAAADRMAELDGRLESAVKAGAMASVLEGVMKKTARDQGGDGAAPDWDDVEKRLRRLEELSPDDPDLDSLRRLAKTEGMTPELVREDSLARLGLAPANPREQEILAWADWRLGRRDEAMRILSEALRRNPGDASLRANWEVVKDPAAKAEDFKISIQVGVRLSEILR